MASHDLARRPRVGKLRRVALLLSFTILGCDQAAAAESPLVEGDPAAAPTRYQWSTRSVKENDIQIFKGISPSKGNWQSLLTAHLTPLPSDKSKDPTCTATFVGPNVLLTAAHCVLRGAQVAPSSIELDVDSYTIIFICTVDKAYAKLSPIIEPRSGSDYALCKAKPDAPRPPELARIQPDWINVSPLLANANLLAAGYGCTSWHWNANTDRYDPGAVSPTLTVGDVAVEVSDPENPLIASSSDGTSQPAICGGDSGGPAFSGVSVSALDGARDIRAIASSIDYRTVKSHFASVGTTQFRNFIACWRGANPGAIIHIRASKFDADVAARQCGT